MPLISPISVLHLEDSDLDAEFVRVRLERSGLAVAVERVSDRKEFVARLESRRYDLILSDYQVPTFEGLAALELARVHQPDTPFIFVSGAMGEELAVETLKQGATDYVLKDRLTRLPAAIERALAEARERAERKAIEGRLSLALKAGRMGTWDLDLETGRLVCSDSFKANYGRGPDELLTAGALAEAILEEDRPAWRRATEEAVARGADIEVEHRVVWPDGSVHWVLVRARCVRTEEGQTVALTGLSLNIDDRKRAEAELAERDYRYRLVADAANDAIWDWDLGSDQVAWNEGMRLRFGYAEDAVGTDSAWWHGRIHPDDAPRVRQDLHAQIDHGPDTWHGEYRFRRADGTHAYVLERAQIVRDAAGQAVRMVGSMLDLTERRRAEEALRAAEERFAFVRRSSGVGFWYCDLPFDVLEWDELVKLHFHLPPDARVTIQTFYERLHPEDREPTRKAIEHAIAEHLPYDVDYRAVDPASGAERWIRAIGRTFYAPDGTPARFDGVTIDISAQKRAQAERERLLKAAQEARDEAETANRMKDEFLATLSHELRTPLNAIVGWTKILRSTKVDDEDREAGLEVIDRNARAQAQLIEDLLDISRIISGKLTLDVQRINLHEVIEGALGAVLPAAEAKGVRVHKVLDSLAGPITGDPNRLQQAVWNLLTNAVKFTPRGGKIQVLLERVNSHVEISVIDTGQGIHPDFLPHVFDRFRQADGSTTRRHGGLGLGLSIVKQLVELHGGSVRVKSPGEGQGATFVLALPITVVHPEQPPRAAPRNDDRFESDDACGDNDLTGLRVLVVDDEADARILMSRVLKDCGAEVKAAGSVPEAIGLLDGFRPEILVSDVGMPEHDGYDLIRQVRGRLSARQLPAVALTAFARSEDRMRALRAGFQVHVAKPVDPEELVAVVASLTARTGGKPEARGANS